MKESLTRRLTCISAKKVYVPRACAPDHYCRHKGGNTGAVLINPICPTCNKEGSNPGVCSRCWSSRPGVATRMFILMTEVCSSRNSFLPPVINPADSWWCFPNSRSTSKIWRDSSLVGDITSAARPSLEAQKQRTTYTKGRHGEAMEGAGTRRKACTTPRP